MSCSELSNPSPNHALQRTAPASPWLVPAIPPPAPILPAALPQPPRRPPQSLSLGSLGAHVAFAAPDDHALESRAT
jgi:hypothetical protein